MPWGECPPTHRAARLSLPQANSDVVGVTAKEEGGCVLSISSSKPGNACKPAQTFRDIELSKDFKRVAKTIGSISKGKRPDLVKTALTRWYKINKSQVGAASTAAGR